MELFRLCRDVVDIHAVRDWLSGRGVVLRVMSGPLSNFHDLAANDAMTALLINVITAVGQFQCDLQNELTAEGIAAAEAEGRYRGRPPALTGTRLAEFQFSTTCRPSWISRRSPSEATYWRPARRVAPVQQCTGATRRAEGLEA
ncbi:recombinase family protein, partial [Nonomuraea sp. NPDC049158]|uniref:recombinase family protein n=1 Tax=Nonomuraea sp. NPDC049158 TaxID=3155649 RepID=UPI0033D5FD9B